MTGPDLVFIATTVSAVVATFALALALVSL
jgi:hypothetical protein